MLLMLQKKKSDYVITVRLILSLFEKFHDKNDFLVQFLVIFMKIKLILNTFSS